MSVTRIVRPVPEPDQVLDLLQGLSAEVQASLKAFTASPPTDPAAIARVVGDLFSFIADLTAHTAQAHEEHYEAIADIDDQLAAEDSRLTPADAGKLKATILTLMQHLRVPSDDVLDAVRARAEEAVKFIDEVTIVEGDDDEGDPDEETET